MSVVPAAVHVQFYLTLLDNYVPDPEERAAAFAAVENIPSIAKKADFCVKRMDSIQRLHQATAIRFFSGVSIASGSNT